MPSLFYIYAHVAIWKERGLMDAKNSPIKYGAGICHLTEVAQNPKLVAVIHCPRHQRKLTFDYLLAGKGGVRKRAKTF